MEEFADRRAKGFSQGQRIKTALARALVHRPQNMLLDEPTNGLDVMAVRALRALLQPLRDAGHCVLFSSHVMQEVSALCDEVVVIAARHGARGRHARRPSAPRTGTAGLEEAFVQLIGGAEMSLTMRADAHRVRQGVPREPARAPHADLGADLRSAARAAAVRRRAVAEPRARRAAGRRPLTLAVAHGERAPNLLAFLRQYGVTVTAVDYDDAAARAAVAGARQPLVLAVTRRLRRAARGRAAGAAASCTRTPPTPSARRSAERVRVLLAQYGALLGAAAPRGARPRPAAARADRGAGHRRLDARRRSVLLLGTLSYLVLLTMLMGGMYLAIDATAGERERGSLEPLLTVPVRARAPDLRQDPRGLRLHDAVADAHGDGVRGRAALRRARALRHERQLRAAASALAVVLVCLPLVPLGAALMTLVAACTRSYREAQTYLGLVLLVPTLPLVFAGAPGPAAAGSPPWRCPRWASTSSSRACCAMSRCRRATWRSRSRVTLALGALLVGIAGRLYRREALLG